MRVRNLLRPFSNFFLGGQFSRFVFNHDRNAVTHRKCQAVGLANQFLARFNVNKRPLADRTYENIEQFGIHLTRLSELAQYVLHKISVEFRVHFHYPVTGPGEPLPFYRVLAGHDQVGIAERCKVGGGVGVVVRK